MNAKPWDGTGQARRALQGIVRDPQYGAAALSQPAVMSNLLKDFLPDEPREASLLVAAAQADLAGSLRGYLAQGLDPATAVSLTTSSFVSNSSHTQEAGAWVVTELALALGLDPYRTAQAAAPPPTQFVQPTVVTPADALVNQATPSPWQQPPVAAPPRSSSRGPVASAIIGFVGAILVLIASFVPLHKDPFGPSFGVFLGHVDFTSSMNFWSAALSIVTLLAAIAAGIGLLVPGDRPRGRAMCQGMLIALGLLTFMIFAFDGYVLFGGRGLGAGVGVGMLSGVVMLAGGVIGMAAGGNRGAVPAGAGGAVPPGAIGTAPPRAFG
jgi:hypothetical protein